MTRPSILQLIDRARRVGICSHLRPDGDNLGSLLALKKLFENLGKEVFAIGFDPLPTNLAFLPGSQDIQAQEEDLDLDLLWLVDCANYERLGPIDKVFQGARTRIAIDHHESNEYFADINLVHPKKSSTCQMVFDYLEAWDLAIDEDMATCLYTGMLTDTNRFMYESVDEKTLAAASKLLLYGARSQEIMAQVFRSQSLAAKRVEMGLLARAQFFFDERLALVRIDRADLEAGQVAMEDLGPLVDVYRDTDQVAISVLIKEEDGGYKVSFRSKDLAVRPLAEHFGGGGHRLAAGCFIAGGADQVVDQILEVVGHVL